MLNILIKQGDIAQQMQAIKTRLDAGTKTNINVGISNMEPDELIKFHWKRIEFLEWLKPLHEDQLLQILQGMQSKHLNEDLHLAKMALVKDLI